MSIYHSIISSDLATTTLKQVLREGFGGWIARAGKLRRQRATIRILQGLDDRSLHDIGLDRSEIESAARTAGVGRRQAYFDIGGIVTRG